MKVYSSIGATPLALELRAHSFTLKYPQFEVKVRTLFRHYDSDRSGVIDVNELRQMMSDMCVRCTHATPFHAVEARSPTTTCAAILRNDRPRLNKLVH